MVTPDELNRVAKFACRHYTPFSYYAESPQILEQNQGVPQVCICSAFFVRVRGTDWLATAGHVLDGIEAERQQGLKLSKFRIWDGWGPDAWDSNYVPFEVNAATTLRVQGDGLDYGLIPLRQLYVDAMQANKAVPITEEHYERDWPETFEAFAMIGTPGSTVGLERHRKTSAILSQSAVVIPLAEEREPPRELLTPYKRFYARILATEDSPEWADIGGNIVGMSGGPIIGINRGAAGSSYWIVAIQSGWLASRRVIAACYFKNFMQIVGQEIDRVGPPPAGWPGP